MVRPRTHVVVGLLALTLLPFCWFWSRSFESDALIRMMFWHPDGAPSIPAELVSEAGAREVLQSEILYQRVSRRLNWKLSKADYADSVTLVNRKSSWSPTSGIYLGVTATANSPRRAEELCLVTSEEFCGRCQELSQEVTDLLWELEMVRAQGALEKWRYENSVRDEAELKARAELLRRRLALTTAALQMRLKRIRSGEEPVPAMLSEKTRELAERLEGVQSSLDTLWVQGLQDERVSDLKLEFRRRRQELKEAVLAEQGAALSRLESELSALQREQTMVSERAVAQALDQLQELQQGMEAVARAREIAMGEMSMFCFVAREASVGRLLPSPWIRLLPLLVSTAIILGCVGISARQDRTKN